MGNSEQCWLKPEDYHKVVAVNLLGLIDVTHTFMPLIKKTNGRIVNTGKPQHENFEIQLKHLILYFTELICEM